MERQSHYEVELSNRLFDAQSEIIKLKGQLTELNTQVAAAAERHALQLEIAELKATLAVGGHGMLPVGGQKPAR